MIKKVLQSTNRVRRRTKSPEAGCSGAQRQYSEGGSGKWIPFASFCTTGQFNKLGRGYIRHCGPTAAVNVIRTLDNYVRNENENSSCLHPICIIRTCSNIGVCSIEVYSVIILFHHYTPCHIV